jgi:putative hydrolase of the HAD superfamily
LPGQNGDMTIRGLILDYGEVVCRPPAPGKIERLAHLAGLNPESFAARYHQERNPYDRGDLTPADYWSKVVSGTVVLNDELVGTLRRLDVEMWSDVNHEMTEWLREVRAAGLKTALLSNMHPDMAEHVKSFDWLRQLDCATLSCEVRAIKPDRAIYERCLERLQLPGSEVCFIDDREVNVQGAREAGMKAFRFLALDGLRADLAGIGFPVLPRANGVTLPLPAPL